MGNGDITIVLFEKKYQDACVSMFMDGLGTQGNTEEILQLQRWFVKQKTDPETGDMYDIFAGSVDRAKLLIASNGTGSATFTKISDGAQSGNCSGTRAAWDTRGANGTVTVTATRFV